MFLPRWVVGQKITPAMVAGVTDRLWEIGDIIGAVEAFEQQAQKRAA